MLTIDDARRAILAAAGSTGDEEIAIDRALGRVLAEDVIAAADVPGFANSGMDGYAVRAGDGVAPRTLVGESRAGSPAAVALAPGEAIRISTGAAIPDGADAVVPVERTSERDGIVSLEGTVAAGDHVRLPGEDLRRGDVVLARGSRLDPSQLGVAIGAGRAAVRCAVRPRVAVVGTGDELVDPGDELAPGQVYDGNSIVLAALAERDGATVVSRRRAGDSRAATRAALEDALAGADLVLVSGGVSVGPHDHVRPALGELGVEERFWRVALRPGKPTWFGTLGSTLVFGLPGNPASSLVTYVLFARPALAALQGAAPTPRRRAAMADGYRRLADRDWAVRVRLDDDGRAHVTGAQGSHVLSSTVGASGLAMIPAGEGELEAGAVVEVEQLATF